MNKPLSRTDEAADECDDLIAGLMYACRDSKKDFDPRFALYAAGMDPESKKGIAAIKKFRRLRNHH